ncbi:MAG: class I SAM-dependent RNA methyltransferase [Candidatus Sericytochromatia bacterium]|nr:class I SAM-dependent RNA methyltransferase [Candidatus Sericytochromatia bacterium]
MKPYELIATAAFGLESQVAYELKQLGYDDQMVEQGRVRFRGSPLDIARVNLWLRVADRVQLVVGDFPAPDFDSLYDGVKALPWSELITRDAAIPVDGKSIKSRLTSVPAVQGVVKKAIVDALGAQYGLAVLPETGARHRVQIALREDRALVTLDTSGDGLHKRGYRDLVGAAPLKETLAAGLVSLTRWKMDRPFLDPFCGSGTIPIEAALEALKRAPGFHRHFDAESFHFVPATAWQTARAEARDVALKHKDLVIQGSDQDPSAIALAQRHARRAGVADAVNFEVNPFGGLTLTEERGIVLTNPPYAARIGDAHEVEALYRAMGQKLRGFPQWGVYVLCGYDGFERLYGKVADKRRKLFNGQLRCDLHQYYAARPPRPPSSTTG